MIKWVKHLLYKHDWVQVHRTYTESVVIMCVCIPHDPTTKGEAERSPRNLYSFKVVGVQLSWSLETGRISLPVSPLVHTLVGWMTSWVEVIGIAVLGVVLFMGSRWWCGTLFSIVFGKASGPVFQICVWHIHLITYCQTNNLTGCFFWFLGTNNLLVCATWVVLDKLWISGVVDVQSAMWNPPICASELKMETSGTD